MFLKQESSSKDEKKCFTIEMKEKLRKWKIECPHSVLLNMFKFDEAQKDCYIF